MIQIRIMQNGHGWYWEVMQDRDVLARGIADTHAQARADAENASNPNMTYMTQQEIVHASYKR